MLESHQEIDSQYSSCGRSESVVEHVLNFKHSHLATHENWTIGPMFDGGATVISRIYIPHCTDAYR